jgi:hypothetical protein
MSLISGLRHRLRELVRPSAVNRELEEELRDHYEHERRRQIERGVAPDAAERAARGLDPIGKRLKGGDWDGPTKVGPYCRLLMGV